MTPRSLGLFVKKLQPKVGLGRNDILFAYFVVEAKSKKLKNSKRVDIFTIKTVKFIRKFNL